MSGVHLPSFVLGRIKPIASGTYRPAGKGQWSVILGVHRNIAQALEKAAP